MMVTPVILSGGVGGRLWPVSRISCPKQFIPLLTEYSMLQETLMRLHGVREMQTPILVCNAQHRFMVAEQLRTISSSSQRIYLEPVSRNTAPAVTIAVLDAYKVNPESIVLVLPSDHVIFQTASFHNAIAEGESLAQEGYLVTFGTVPNEPKTGFGYIRQGKPVSRKASGKGCYGKAYTVDAFVEKPNLATAEQYVTSGEYFWNSGIFMFKTACYLEELKKHAPDIYHTSLKAFESVRHEMDFSWLDLQAFESCPSESIDYALMEKTSRAVMLPVDMGWSDVGSWRALWDILPKDAQGNVANAQVFMKDVSNSYIHSSKEMVVALGVNHLIIVETEDSLLIAHMDKEQDVKDAFKRLL